MLRRFLVFISVLAVALSMIGASALRASADESTPTLSPTQGPAGTRVTASATDWAGCSSMSVGGFGQTTLATTAIDSTGAFTLSFTVPSNAALGPALLMFAPSCPHSTIAPAATFTVTQGTPPAPSCSPSVSLTPNSGAVGSTFVMAGKGWLPGGTVTITLPSTVPGFFESTTPFTPKVAADGTWQLTAIVGKPSAVTGYTFTYAESGCASQHGTFTVTAPTTTPPPPTCSPSVSISPGSGLVGAHFVMAGKGWLAGGTVSITLPFGSKGVFSSSTWNPAVGSNGGWQITATVGNSPAAGYTFTFAEKGCPSLTRTFTVTAPSPPRPRPRRPAAPSNLSATAVGQHAVKLTWRDNSNNETGFEINNRATSRHAGANSTTYTWSGLAPGTHMCFRIRSYNSAGDSAWDPSASPGYVCTTTPKPTWSYPAGNYAGKSGMVSVVAYKEPNLPKYDDYCGPGASQVLISAWTKNVPGIDTLATEEKTDPNPPKSGTYISDMVKPINDAIGANYYHDLGAASSQADLSNRIGYDILHGHPLITGIKTGVGNTFLNGWDYAGPFRVNHIITIVGFDFSSPTQGKIYYMETSSLDAGTNAAGPQEIGYKSFWLLVQGQANNDQLSGAPS